jgi:hypothetical protein
LKDFVHVAGGAHWEVGWLLAFEDASDILATQ